MRIYDLEPTQMLRWSFKNEDNKLERWKYSKMIVVMTVQLCKFTKKH